MHAITVRQRRFWPLWAPIALLVATLACSQTSPTPAAPTVSAITGTPGATAQPTWTPDLTATEPLAGSVVPATASSTAAPPNATASTSGAPCDNVYLPSSAGSTWT